MSPSPRVTNYAIAAKADRSVVTRLIGGPDVWEMVRAVRSARAAELEMSPDKVIALVAETSGVAEHLVRAAVDYWADYPDDVDAWVDRAERESKSAEERWRRERRLLAG